MIIIRTPSSTRAQAALNYSLYLSLPPSLCGFALQSLLGFALQIWIYSAGFALAEKSPHAGRNCSKRRPICESFHHPRVRYPSDPFIPRSHYPIVPFLHDPFPFISDLDVYGRSDDDVVFVSRYLVCVPRCSFS